MTTQIKNQIPVLEKSIRLLQLISGDEDSANSSSLAKRMGMSQSTCYRILKTLEKADWICQGKRGGYRISFGLFPLLQPLMDLQRIAEIAQPVLDELARKCQMSAKLCARQDRRQVTVAAGKPQTPISILASVGMPYPVVVAASGAALLARLNDEDLECLIATTPAEDWQHDNPAKLRERVRQCRDKGMCENIGHHPQGIDALACPVEFSRMPLSLSLIGLRGDFGYTVLPDLRELLVMARRSLEGLFRTLDIQLAA